MKKLTPTADEMEELLRTAPEGPMVAINLLKFEADGGLEAYKKYLEAGEKVSQTEVKILFAGKTTKDFGGGEDWDYSIIVEFPSARVFADTIMGEGYQQQAVPWRPLALERTLWMPCFPASLDQL